MNAQNNEARWPLAVVIGVCLASTALAQSIVPTITNVRTEGTNMVVTASVPAGVQRVTLETSDRLNRLRWGPRAVMRPQALAQTVTFRLPMSQPVELIRIRADVSEPLPATFFDGTNAFSAPSDSTVRANLDVSLPTTGAGPTLNGDREVVESDIWQLRGSTLYFFNQYRGLQIIDISIPDLAFVRGTLELPAAGDQMYLLQSNHIVLLARDGCSYGESQVLVVADTNGTPRTVARLPVNGTISESRLVGTALYVASQTSRPVAGTTNTVWEWGTLVSAFDLSNPDAPVTRNTLWFSGYGNVVSATDTYLFVVTQSPADWWQSVVNLVDITDPFGTISTYGAITNSGQVLDKFKLNYTDQEVFAVISEDRHQTNGVSLVTRLETFHLPDPRAVDPSGIAKLGQLELGQGERLHATRFDGSRVYVVTFFQIDPLWVVDFSNPKAPRVAGSVEVPGWSTYIEPLGNRLVTLGVETNHVSVSLYDVSDPAAPARLSQVRLGGNYSWSEANYDEKAFTVLPDVGLVLVPFSGDSTNGYTSALQLIDYSPAALQARGQLRSSSGLSYRRATVVKDRILSLSDWELVSVNATDRDAPVISGRLELAQSVDRVILAGHYVIQLSTGNIWNTTTPVVSVVSASAPNLVLDRMELLPLPLLGATKHGDRLYLAQGTTGVGLVDPYNSKFGLTVLNLTNLPSLTLMSQFVTNTAPLGWSANWQAFWPKPDVLVWAGGQEYWCWYNFWIGGGPLGGPGALWRPYSRGSGGNGYLLAFDATLPDAPRLASEVDLRATNRWSFSQSFLADGLIFLSHQTSEFVPDPIPTNGGTWVYRSFLNVVDFAEPAAPIVRKPVNIPNPLIGVADSGALIFSVGSHWGADPTAAWREYLEASAYDGVSAHLVDSLALPAAWPHPTRVLDASVAVGNPGDNTTTNVVPASLETWTLSSAGKFFRAGSVRLGAPVTDLGLFGNLLATASYDSNVDLFDATDAANLQRIGSGQAPVCWWWPNLTYGDGNTLAGLWLPLSAYGMAHIPASR